MPKRKTSEDYRILAESRGFEWLGPKVSNGQTKTNWKCPKGHDWLATYNTIQQGHGCPHCIRKLPEDYHQLAKERDFEWLGPEVGSVNTKTAWKCSQGHRWEAVYANIYSGYGCPDCKRQKLSLRRLKKPADYYALAKSRGFEWLGPEVKSVRVKTKWQCPEGHIWKAGYYSLQIGNGCPHCGNASSAYKRKKKPEDYRVLAKKRGLIWLGPEAKNNSTKTNWKCPKGHEWKTAYNNILSGQGCPECAVKHRANKRRKKPRDYHVLATERGFKWLGPEVKDAHVKTVWKCLKEHEWEANYNAIQQGRGCPYCMGNNASMGEEIIASLLDRLGYQYSRQVTFDECRSGKNGILRFDFMILIKDWNYLIEYDGIQHFEPIEYWGGKKALKTLIKGDTIKNKFAKDHRIPLLRVPYTDFDNIEGIVTDWLDSLQDKPTRMDKPPRGAKRIYKNKGNWMIATQLSLLDI